MLSEKPWRPDRVVWLLAGFFSTMLLASIVVLGYREISPEPVKNQLIVFLVGIFTFHGVTLVLVHIFLQQHQITWSEAFGFREPRLARALFLGALVSILILPVALSLTELSGRILKYLGMGAEPQQAVQMMREANSGLQLLIQGIAAIAFAPVVEEIVFRGILYPAVKRNGNPKFALWGVSFFFALTHSNLTVILPLTVLAIILTFLYETTRNLLAPIMAHSLFNAVNFAFLVYQRYQGGAL